MEDRVELLKRETEQLSDDARAAERDAQELRREDDQMAARASEQASDSREMAAPRPGERRDVSEQIAGTREAIRASQALLRRGNEPEPPVEPGGPEEPDAKEADGR